MDDFAALDATAQADLVGTGAASPSGLLDAALARIDRPDPEVNAVIHRLDDRAAPRRYHPKSVGHLPPSGGSSGGSAVGEAYVEHFINMWAAGNAGTMARWEHEVGRAAGPEDVEPLTWGLVQFVGRFGAETTLDALAGQLERASPWADRWPGITAVG